MFFYFFMCFRFLPAGQLVCSTDPQAILLRVQNRKIVPHIIPAGQKSVLILSSYMATPNTTSSEERVNSGSYMGTCEGTWSYHLVFLFFYFFWKRVSNGSRMEQSTYASRKRSLKKTVKKLWRYSQLAKKRKFKKFSAGINPWHKVRLGTGSYAPGQRLR